MAIDIYQRKDINKTTTRIFLNLWVRACLAVLTF